MVWKSAGLGLVILLLAGCGGDAPPNGKNGQPEVERPSIALPKLSEPPPPRRNGKLALLAEGENTLRLGDSKEVVEKVFPAPPGALPFKALPPGFEKGYETWGYETSREGFGAIFHDNGLILAMERRENLDPAIVTETVGIYERAFGRYKDFANSDRITYWFWEEEGRRIMISSTPDSRDAKLSDMTISFGDITVMDAFRMGIIHANNDIQALEKK